MSWGGSRHFGLLARRSFDDTHAVGGVQSPPSPCERSGGEESAVGARAPECPAFMLFDNRRERSYARGPWHAASARNCGVERVPVAGFSKQDFRVRPDAAPLKRGTTELCQSAGARDGASPISRERVGSARLPRLTSKSWQDPAPWRSFARRAAWHQSDGRRLPSASSATPATRLGLYSADASVRIASISLFSSRSACQRS